MATNSNSFSSFNETPARLPKVSNLTENDLMEINWSQEDDPLLFEMEECASKDNYQENKLEEIKEENTKRKKRLMRYDSAEDSTLKSKKNKKDPKAEDDKKKIKLEALLNPKKRI